MHGSVHLIGAVRWWKFSHSMYRTVIALPLFSASGLLPAPPATSPIQWIYFLFPSRHISEAEIKKKLYTCPPAAVRNANMKLCVGPSAHLRIRACAKHCISALVIYLCNLSYAYFNFNTNFFIDNFFLVTEHSSHPPSIPLRKPWAFSLSHRVAVAVVDCKLQRVMSPLPQSCLCLGLHMFR